MKFRFAVFVCLCLVFSAAAYRCADAQINGTVTTTLPAAEPGAPAAPITQNTVTTTGPVTSGTTISVGSLASEALAWVAAAFTGIVGTALTRWLMNLAKKSGFEITDAARDRLQEIIVNGLNAAAAKGGEELKGKGQVEIKNEVVAGAVAYTQAHATETLKALGLDPTSGAAVEAIKARIETAISDPASPTPEVLDAPAKAA
jgi:hypothetical protein